MMIMMLSLQQQLHKRSLDELLEEDDDELELDDVDNLLVSGFVTNFVRAFTAEVLQEEEEQEDKIVVFAAAAFVNFFAATVVAAAAVGNVPIVSSSSVAAYVSCVRFIHLSISIVSFVSSLVQVQKEVKHLSFIHTYT